VERAFLLAVAAVAWPFWVPFLRAVLQEIRAADRSLPEAPPAIRPRAERLVNAAWDDAHLRLPGKATGGAASAPRTAGGAGRGGAWGREEG
jgi:hypothetical protein